MGSANNKLPVTGPAREALREKGQFWTPDWIAQAMVAYVVSGGADVVFDPAVGAGAFLRAAKAVEAEIGRRLRLRGREVDPGALREALEHGLSEHDVADVEIRDFLREPPTETFRAIVANPPYIRHHRLRPRLKTELQSFGAALLGAPIDGRAGLHVYFLLRALTLMREDGRLAFIMPADTCEGVFARGVWQWITERYRLEAVVTFDPDASPFPGVDTNPLILMIRNAPPAEDFLWVRCHERGGRGLTAWVLAGCAAGDCQHLSVHRRRLAEGLATGLSRPPASMFAEGPALAQFARVMRGVASGANEFFMLTHAQARAFGIPDEFLVRAVGRTRDVPGDRVDEAVLEALEKAGRPTLLFSPDDRPRQSFPAPVQAYLAHGEEQGIHRRTLVATRRPWYKMEVRAVPPILFAYLGRRNARFIRNEAGVIPLTGFLCVYPESDKQSFVTKLWDVLRHPDTLANLPLVAKSYGGGALKVEPRALERLPLPRRVVADAGLHTSELFEPD